MNKLIILLIFFFVFFSIKSEKPVKPTVTIEISSDDSNIVEPLQAVTASLHFKSGDKEILFGYGDKHFLLFEHVVKNLKFLFCFIQ